jgi:hypothetical protein
MISFLGQTLILIVKKAIFEPIIKHFCLFFFNYYISFAPTNFINNKYNLKLELCLTLHLE